MAQAAEQKWNEKGARRGTARPPRALNAKVLQMQNNVTPRSFGSANGLPWIKAATYRGIMMLAADIGGPIDFSPEQRFPGARHGVLLEGANLLIVGTRTGPNIGLYDVSAVTRQYGMDLLLARFSGPVAKYDIYRCKDDQWFTGYQRAWFEDRYWFCPPDEVDQPFILAHRRGLQFSTHAPCPDARRFEAGLSLAAQTSTQWQEAA